MFKKESNIMKLQYLVFSLLLCITSCQDKKTKTNVEVPVVKVDAIEKKKTDEKPELLKTAKEERAFPYLDDETAMEFFLQYEKKNPENTVRITTRFGDIDILLFDETKFHRANFIFLTKQNYFEDTQFYRIVNNFIIQAGNSDNPKIADKRSAIGRYLLPTDTNRGFKHHRGVVSMPSSEIDNPYKLASPYEFFIVQSPKGAYHLDGDYTIFGKVIRGMDVVDEIASQPTDGSEWPMQNIYIKKAEIIN